MSISILPGLDTLVALIKLSKEIYDKWKISETKYAYSKDLIAQLEFAVQSLQNE